MAKYHINLKGEPGVCRAKKNCPFGDAEHHYDSAHEARSAYESNHDSWPSTEIKGFMQAAENLSPESAQAIRSIMQAAYDTLEEMTIARESNYWPDDVDDWADEDVYLVGDQVRCEAVDVGDDELDHAWDYGTVVDIDPQGEPIVTWSQYPSGKQDYMTLTLEEAAPDEPLSSFDGGVAKVQELARNYGLRPGDLARIGSQHMLQEIPDLDEIGSSDITHHLVGWIGYDPEGLREAIYNYSSSMLYDVPTDRQKMEEAFSFAKLRLSRHNWNRERLILLASEDVTSAEREKLKVIRKFETFKKYLDSRLGSDFPGKNLRG